MNNTQTQSVVEINQHPQKHNYPPNRKPRKILSQKEIQQAAILQEAGFKQIEIADIQGVDRTTIWKYLKQFQVNNKILKKYEGTLQDEVLKSLLDDLNLSKRVINYFNNLSDDEFNKLTPTTLLTLKRSNDIGLGIKVEKHRLITGQSTSNLAIEGVLRTAHQGLFKAIKDSKPLGDDISQAPLSLDGQGVEIKGG